MSSPSERTISFIIPVFNRQDEVEELLASMAAQTEGGFEVVLVEDGSEHKSDEIAERYADRLNVKYFYKANSGPGQSRNYGFERASGNYGIFLDSDCVLPPDYFRVITQALRERNLDCFGGPDAAHEDFTDTQKAINYAMTSTFTTGGIRGSSEKMEKFHPRSFNMGYSREVFEQTGGFSKLRFGEDIDMSIRINRAGFTAGLVKEAFVYHKRRATLRQFFKQVFNSGIARINLHKAHPGSLKLVHFAPAVFTLGVTFAVLLGLIWSPVFFAVPLIYALLILVDATVKTGSLTIGARAVVASFVMLFGYGTGFLSAFWKRIVLGKDVYSAFEKTFYD
ncbi:glycosyltransferase [Lewinella sp. 4G2]|uniref:glycosyltransferase n=1 Tax=Lewinella sp. 4G2 TaxID=1803372 RepID=UPI0007B48A82|nr:glycosyltransferase [Lewinella sp. 4G2]OAV43405.1 glycosyl transferase family 2 [Lewinella sp. 4G2]